MWLFKWWNTGQNVALGIIPVLFRWFLSADLVILQMLLTQCPPQQEMYLFPSFFFCSRMIWDGWEWGECYIERNLKIARSSNPRKFSRLFFSAGLICCVWLLFFIFLLGVWWEGDGWDLVALLIPSVHTLIDDGGVKYVRNSNNNNNETICKPVVIVVTQTCAKGLCMYLNVRFRGLFSEHVFLFLFFLNLFTHSFRSHRCPVWTV